MGKINNFIIYQIYKNKVCKKRVLFSYMGCINYKRKGFPESEIIDINNSCLLYDDDDKNIYSLSEKLIEQHYQLIPADHILEFDNFEANKLEYLRKYSKPDFSEFMEYYGKYKRKDILKKINISATLYKKFKNQAEEWLNKDTATA